MKALPTLLRIARRELDLIRRSLGEAEARHRLAVDRLAAHDADVVSERQRALETYEGGRAFPAYVRAAAGQRAALEAQMRALEAEADRLRALVTQAHVEAKKLEHLIALEDAREAEAARRAETAALDELATLRAARKG